MTPTHFKAKREGMFVPVPANAKSFDCYRFNWLEWETGSSIKGMPFYVQLPEGSWKIVGDTETMKEDDWSEVVERIGWADPYEMTGVGYRNYFDRSDDSINTATDSGHSLMRSLGLDPSARYIVLIKNDNK